MNKKKIYQKSKSVILEEFKINENKGILNKDLKFKLEKYGKNSIEIKKDITFLDLYLEQIKSFLNLLLLFIIIFSLGVWFWTKKFEYLVDFIVISLILLFNTLIGAYQNYSSNKISKVLNNMLKNKSIVLRNGKKEEIDSTDLFPGDIVYLSSGTKIPADCYLLKIEDLKVNESILTGESLPVKKNLNLLKEVVQISDIKNMVFMNTFVNTGNATAIVVKTGKNTEMGKIATSIQNKAKKISFISEIDEVSKKISIFAIGLILIVSVILFLKGLDLISIFLVSSALIIGSIPEGLPAIVVFLLSKSIHKLAKSQVLVKDMGLLETLGSIDILCTDKTGTLTENKMKLKRLYLNGKEISKINSLNKSILDKFSQIVTYVNDVKVVDSVLEGEPEDIALLEYLKLHNLKNEKKIKVREFEPFNSDFKYSSSKLVNGDFLKKGAPEILLDSCKYILIDGKRILINKQIKEGLLKQMGKFTDEALRLIGFSYSNSSQNEIFLGFCGLYDKPKEGIKKTIETLYSAKIEVKMITGDNKFTAIAIGKECGFRNIKSVEWSEIVDLNDVEFEKVVLTHNIFSRMTPDFKEKILKVLQKNGHRVAITGDGVNDSMALKQADVGVVMGNGSDIAKESGDLILINNDLRDIPLAIKEGRGIFHNIRKVVNYLLTANLAEVLTIFIASFFGLIPFTAIQILWVNFVTDIAPAMSLGIDKYPNKILNKKPNGKNEKILNLRIILLTIFISVKKTILIFVMFLAAYYYSNKDLIFAQTMAFTWLVTTHFVRIAAIRFSEKVNFFSNKSVNYSLFGVVLIQLIILYSPLKTLFIVESPPFYWILVLLLFIIQGIYFAKVITNIIDWYLKKYTKEVINY